jgi:hypothetical protein
VQRAAGIFVAGIVFGILIGYFMVRAGRTDSKAVASNSPVANIESRKTESATTRSDAEADKIILGNIASVPFQELYGVLSSRSADEMAELARQLNDLPPGRETKTKINAFFAAWARLDAKAALTAAISLKTPEARALATSSVVRSADASVAQSLVATLSQLPADALSPTQKTRSLSTALSRWSEADPVAAAKFLDQFPSRDRGFFGARMSIAENWATTDPTAALAWAQAQGDPQETRASMAGVVSGWWETDPRAAEAYVAAHLDTLGLDSVMRITTQLFQQDPQRAKEWANSLSTTEARRTANSFLVNQMAETDPKGASEWAASLPEDVRSRTLSAAISRWARNDLRAAGEWINRLDGAIRDEAVSTYSAVAANSDPAAGLTWAATLSDPKLRSSTVARIVTSWLRRSPADARAWVQNSSLPEPEKTRLLALSPGK